MARRVGLGTFLGWGEESTYGTAVAAGQFLPLQAGDENLQFEVETVISENFAERGLDKSTVVKGPERVTGSFAFDLQFGGGWPMFLAHLISDASSTSGAGPYTHVYDVGNYDSGLAGKGISLLVFRDGILTSSDDVERLAGCRPTAMEFTFEQGKVARCSVDFIGASVDYIVKPSESYGTTGYVKSPSDAASPTAAWQYGTDASETAYTVRTMSIRIEQEHAEIRDLQSPKMLEPAIAAPIMVTGSAEVLYQGASTAADQFTQDYQAQTFSSLLMTLEGATAANESIVFDMPDVMLTAPPTPRIADAGPVYQTVEWRAFRDSAANEATITIINGDSTAYS